jgi:hypothetical protein
MIHDELRYGGANPTHAIHHEGREEHEGKIDLPRRDKRKNYFFVTFVRFVVSISFMRVPSAITRRVQV